MCRASGGTYGPFKIASVQGADGHLIKFEVPSGQTASIDMSSRTTTRTSDDALYYDLMPGTYDGIEIDFRSTYVSVSGFTVTGNNQALLSSGSNPADRDQMPNGIYDANCIGITGQKEPTEYVGTTAVYPSHIFILNNTTGECGGAGIGATYADYITVAGNYVYDNAWYSIYGSSGIALLSSYPGPRPPNDTSTYQNVVANNYVINNHNEVIWEVAGKITDGEGINIDTNLNSAANPDADRPSYGPYDKNTLVANNVVIDNGAAGISVFESRNVDVAFNSTYNNDLTPSLSGRGEVALFDAQNVRVISNILFASSQDSPFANDCNGNGWVVCSGSYSSNNVYYSPSGTYRSTSSLPYDSGSVIGNPGYQHVDSNLSNRFHVDLHVNMSANPNLYLIEAATPWLMTQSDIDRNARTQASNGYYLDGAYK